jgi:toxic protein SymE
MKYWRRSARVLRREGDEYKTLMGNKSHQLFVVFGLPTPVANLATGFRRPRRSSMRSPDRNPIPCNHTYKREHKKAEASAPCCNLVWVEPTLTPMLTEEQIAALNAAEAAKAQAGYKRSRPRRPRTCRVGSSHYAHSDRCVPSIRLRGGWLAQMGIVDGDDLRVEFLHNAVVLTRIEPLPPSPTLGRHKRYSGTRLA